MNDTKHPLQSLGIMGPVVAGLVYLANKYKPGLGLDAATIGPVIDQIDVLAGLVLAIYGRWRATAQISVTK